MMRLDDKIYIAGRGGMVGSSIERTLRQHGYNNIIGLRSSEMDLRDQCLVSEYFEQERPDIVILAAAKVGGIQANINSPAEFLYDNLMIQNNIIHNAYLTGAKKLLFLGSSCIYPRESPQPMKEEYLLTGKLEPTNEGYAIAKIAGIKMCETYNKQYHTKFISAMPCNIYGIGDNFDPINSHVVAGLMRKFHEGKIENRPSLEVWGTGKARRELLFSEDLGDACYALLEGYSQNEFINIGTGEDISIEDLASLVRKVVGYNGEIRFNTDMPDGMPQKLLDVSRLKNFGWEYQTSLEEGLEMMYRWFVEQMNVM